MLRHNHQPNPPNPFAHPFANNLIPLSFLPRIPNIPHLLSAPGLRETEFPKVCQFSLRRTHNNLGSYEMIGGGIVHSGSTGARTLTIFAVLPEPTALGLRRYDAYLVTTPPTGIYRQLVRVPDSPNLWTAHFEGHPSIINMDSTLYIGGSATYGMAAPPGHRVLLEGKLSNCK